MKCLQEITGQENGIVIYGNDLIICNWSAAADGSLPVTVFNDVLFIPDDTLSSKDDFEAIHVENIADEIKDKNIVYDLWDDIQKHLNNQTTPIQGKKYMIGNCTIIAPDGWN